MQGDAVFDDADLNGLVDGRIDPARAAALDASLASDPGARARIDAWRRQNDSLRTMFASILTEPVPVRLLPVAVGARDRGEPRDGAGRGRLAAAVASAVVGAGLVGFALGALASFGTDGFGLTSVPARTAEAAEDGPSSEPGDFTTRAAEVHRTFVADPAHAVEIAAGDEARLLRWIHHRVGGTLRIPALARQGWTFLGGRVVPGRSGPAALLVYGNGNDRLGLVMARAAGSGDPRTAAVDDGAGPIAVATWGDGEFAYALTSARGVEWLDRNVGPLREAVRTQAHADDAGVP